MMVAFPFKIFKVRFIEDMKKWFLPILSGILLTFSYPPFSIKILPFLALLPLFFFLNIKKISPKKSFCAGFLTGFIFFSGIMFWTFDLLPLDWMGIENKAIGFLIIFFLWLLPILISASFLGIFSLGHRFLRRKNFWDALLTPSLWILLEYLGCWFFAIITLGKESLFGPHWTLGNLAYSLAQNSNFRFLASTGGIYLVSFLIILINVLIFFLLRKLGEVWSPIIKKDKKAGLLYFTAILIIVGLISATYFIPFPKSQPEEGQVLKVAILQTKFSPSIYQTKKMIQEEFQIKTALLKKVALTNPDIIIFPENSRFLIHQEAKKVLSELFFQKEAFIIDSSPTEIPEGGKFIGVFGNTRGDVLAKSTKRLLLPFGEYPPYIIKIPAQIINIKWIEELERSMGRKKGKEITTFSSPDGWQGGILFCSEITSPILFRQIVKKDAQIFFNLGGLAFSHGSKTLDSQIKAMLQFRAAENGRYLIRATNYGSSYIINERGEIIVKTPNFENQALFGKVKPISKKTPYTKYSDWILILAGLASLTFLYKRCIII